MNVIYCKILIVSREPIIIITVQKTLFSGELIFGGAYFWREFCVSKCVWLDNKNSLKCEDKQLKTATPKSP